MFGKLLLIMFVLYYMAEEGTEIMLEKWGYFKDGWNILDWCNLLLLITSFVFTLMTWIDGSSMKIGLAETNAPDDYTDLQGEPFMI